MSYIYDFCAPVRPLAGKLKILNNDFRRAFWALLASMTQHQRPPEKVRVGNLKSLILLGSEMVVFQREVQESSPGMSSWLFAGCEVSKLSVGGAQILTPDFLPVSSFSLIGTDISVKRPW